MAIWEMKRQDSIDEQMKKAWELLDSEDDLRTKINQRMDMLQYLMENQYHLDRPDEVYDFTLTISKFWSALDEGDREYIQCSQDACEDKRPWK
tara:strand:- start:4045 stop:4323 length:279 start_codon:yes stop_codon:yes gene_type:complete